MTAVLSVLKQAWQSPRYVAASTVDPQLHLGTWPGSASAIARVLDENLIHIIPARVAENSPAEQPQQICLQAARHLVLPSQRVEILSQKYIYSMLRGSHI
jgi:hypothetical protein